MLGLALIPASAIARVPPGFVGMNAGGPVLDPRASLQQQLGQMVASGVESIREAFSWSAAQPYASFAQVPAAMRGGFENIGGVPTTFAAIDPIVGTAAARGVSLLPVVLYAPTWDARSAPAGDLPGPASVAPYAHFLAALVGRYGPRGTFWRKNPQIPKLPIRMWQIWNEPDHAVYWPIQPFERSYMRLVHAAHDAIKSADPGAKVVLAGMPDYSWTYLAQIYKIPGARRFFDVVAAHPFTSKPDGVITILKLIRDVMDHNGDASKPILATEVSWPSSLGKAPQFGFETTEAGQASKTAELLPKLASNRRRLRLIGFYYYAWIVGDEHPGSPSFDFAGLLRIAGSKIVRKPAFFTFTRAALALEGCRQKASAASHCLRPG
jgi:hypothetical protein